ncbi:hypothetical protein PX699_00340 [Sphingobium sp. H39-3-25]|uniref:hypothetical protein n=1 Tax=Sphingobium arseniciresistens TaxID=3030834 RepID=UPI0023B8F8BE|nr:hypothetical protein [Sphingobium arseniciresistens]
MTEYHLIYDLETGMIRWPGSGPEGHAAAQVLMEGTGIIIVPQEAYDGGAVNWSAIRDSYCARIDAEAVIHYPVRTEAQALKAAELEGSTGTNLIGAEAAATGVDEAIIRAAVAEQHAAWAAAFASIEGKRQATKAGIRAAEGFAAILAAAQVNWSA